MATEKTVNYTLEMVADMKTMYEAGRRVGAKNADLVKEIAARVNRPSKSVIAKMVREGFYVKDEIAPKTASKDEGPSKKELLMELERVAPDFPLEGLNPATKQAISEVIALVRMVNAMQAPEEEAA